MWKRGLNSKIAIAVCAFLLVGFYEVLGQEGGAGITSATTKLGQYFALGIKLMYAIGAVVGLVGAVRVYNKWTAGEPDTTKVASAWFGACIFLVVVSTILKSFFGV